MILGSTVKKDLMQMSGGVHTTMLEVFHNVIAKYLPKLYHFEYDRMEVGTMLAALDNNYNTGRSQKKSTKTTGLRLSVKNHYRIAYRKPSKKYIARKFYEKKSYIYLRNMLSEIRRRSFAGIRSLEKAKRKVMAPQQYDRKQLITDSVKYKRFKF